ncbi:MAG: AAA family ATPase [Corynebacterium sp.]|nr:AAA family ATPase [Corynebacterium sp.]
MHIHNLEVRDFHGINEVVLHDLPASGIIMIAGPNEAGKSTVLHAIDLIFRFRHGSNAGAVREAQPYGRDVGPEVHLHATIGEIEFRVTKRWLRQSKCELEIIHPHPTRLTGVEAEDRLEAIYNQLDSNLRNCLFVGQGELEVLDNLGGVEPLREVLSSKEAHGQPDSSDVILQAVTKRYFEYFTKSHRDKSTSVVKLKEQEVELLHQRVSTLATQVTAIERCQGELTSLESQFAAHTEALPELNAALTAAKQAFDSLNQAENELRAAHHQHELIEQRVAHLEKQEKDLVNRQQQVGQQEERIAILVSQQEAVKAQLEQLEKQPGVSTEETNALVKRQEALNTELSQLERFATGVQEKTQLAEANKRLQEAKGLNTEIAELEHITQISSAQLQELRSLQTAWQVSQERLNAQAVRVRLRASEPTSVAIHSGGDAEPIEVTAQPQIHEVHQPTEFAINGVYLEVTPSQAMQDAATVTPEEVAAAKEAFEKQLAALDVPDVASAQQIFEASLAIKAQLNQARRQLDNILQGESQESLTQLVTRYEAAVAQFQDTLDDQQTARFEAYEQADSEQRKTQRDKLQTELHNVSRDLRLKQEEVQKRAVDEARLDSQHKAALQRHEEATQIWARLQEEMRRAMEAFDASALATARTQLHAAAAEFSVKQKAVDSGAPTEVRANLAEAERRLQTNQRESASLQGRIEGLRKQIQEGGQIRRDHAQAQEELECAKAALEPLILERDAIKLLYTKLQDKFEAMTQRYSHPLRIEMEKLASEVYDDDIRFKLDSKLVVETRTDKRGTIAIQQLSGGAKEQLALIQRVSMARLVGADSAIFIDDPMGATDPQRQKDMAPVFTAAARDTQLFLLTCDPQRFSALDPVQRIDLKAGSPVE